MTKLLLKYILIPLFAISFTTCSINREDIFYLVSNPPLPDIEVVGYSYETGYHDFGFVDLYQTDYKTFTIINNGRGKLRIYGISFVEDDTDGFTLDTSATASIVNPGNSTIFTIMYKPTALISNSVTVIIYSNSQDKNPYTFTINGTGTGEPIFPDINIRQGTADIPIGGLTDFGNVQIGNSSLKVFTIENKLTGELSILDISVIPGGGTSIGEFNLVTPSIPTSISEDESIEFTVIFSPQDIGIKSATISILNDDPDENPYSFGVQGEGSLAPQPDINLKQGASDIPDGSGSYHFGYVQCDSSSQPTTFVIQNTGTAFLNITSIMLTAGNSTEFSIDTSATIFTLIQGENTTFTIKFLPNSSPGYKWATVTIVNDDPDEDPYTFTIEGEAVAVTVPDIDVQEVTHNSEYDFGPVILGSSKTEPFTIANTGTTDLNIASIVNCNPDKFTLDASMTALLVPSGFITTFNITFTPVDQKSKTATIEIYSDDPDENPYKFKVAAYGTDGTEPDINVRQGTVNYPDGSQFYFPDIEVDEESTPVVFTIENNGSADLEIESILLVWKHIGDFKLDYDPDHLIIQPGGSILVTTWFSPTKTGLRQTKLQMRSNDPNEDIYEIKLTGNGIED
ncbi:MAG: choice-of-anchor D domain-containing protein [Spirochaetota bacterium]|nr:MAG: choice-of-anchor D domain-containing protein [Spirochaetota bacterium]